MSGSQVATSSSELQYAIYGFNAISLTNWTTSAASVIAAGSQVEVAGAFFTYSGNDTNDATSFSAITTGATAYLQLVPSGTAGSQIVTSSWTSTAPTWRQDRFGYYASAASATRYVAGCIKTGATSYEFKFLLKPLHQNQINDAISFTGPNAHSGAETHSGNEIFTGVTTFSGGWNNSNRSITNLTSGSGNYTVPSGVYQLKVICVGGGGGGAGGGTYATVTTVQGGNGGNSTFGTVIGLGGGGGGRLTYSYVGGAASISNGGAYGQNGYSDSTGDAFGGNGGGAGGRGGATIGGFNNTTAGNYGGGGGGGFNNTVNVIWGGGGGGGTVISDALAVIMNTTPGSLIAYSVGAGGSAGAAGGSNGNAGGTGGSGIIIVECL